MADRSYAVFGQLPAQIERPETVEQAQEIIRSLAGKALVPWGGGTRQNLGFAPTRYDAAISTERLNKITEYQPADLTVTAQAGVTVGQLQEALAAHGQFLPLDVALPDRQTIGGIIAARAGSLRRLSCGSVRDSLLGVKVINDRAELIKGGGKVVKNVAGYDLPKLYCGSLGTLGLIVEATFKVAPLPEAWATALLPLDANHNSEDVLDTLLGSDLAPAFLFLLNPSAAHAVRPEAAEAQYLAVGFNGSSESVAWQVQTLGAETVSEETSALIRARLRDFALESAPMTVSFHILSSQVGAFVRMIEWTAHKAGFSAQIIADAALGLLSAHFAPMHDGADWMLFYIDLKDKADRCGGSFIIEQMPEELRLREVPVWSPLLPDFALMARLKASLDPSRMWNPGRFVGGL